MLHITPHPPRPLRFPFLGTSAGPAAALVLTAGILGAPSIARSRVPDTAPLPVTLLAPGSSPLHRGVVAPSVYAAAAGDTVYFGGTFWNADSSRWEALRDSVWTFDSGAGSSLVPPGGSTYPGVNPYKQAGLHQTMEGWVGTDNTFSELTYFRRLSVAETPCVGVGAGLGGSWSLYAGVLPAEAVSLCYAQGAGYGNDWHICIGKSFSWSGGPVGLSFTYRCDSEPNYDFAQVICDTSGTGNGDVTVITYTGATSGSDVLTLTAGSTLPQAGPRSVIIKFCAISDELYSDEDGVYPTECGLFAVDDIGLSGGIVQPLEGFETGDGGWTHLPAPPGYGGEWANVVSLNDLPPTLAGCQCALRDSVLVFEDLTVNGHGLFQNDIAASPWIDLEGNGLMGPGKFFRADIYANLVLLNYLFAQFEMQWYPELCLETGKFALSRWTSNGFVYYFGGVPNCVGLGRPTGASLDFSTIVPESAEEVRLGVGVISYCSFYAECTYVTNDTPWFDNLALGVYGAPGAPYLAARTIDLPQDAFPQDGTVGISSPARIDCNTIKPSLTSPLSLGDTLVVEGGRGPGDVEVRVQFAVRPGPGTNAGNLQAWLTKHHYEETKDGLAWYSARMDTAEQGAEGPKAGYWMTAYHEEDPSFIGTDRDLDPGDLDPAGGMTRLKNDIFPDNLFTPGSRLLLFYKAHYLGSPAWYVIPDTAGGNAYEMEVLPSSMEPGGTFNGVLFVDHADGLENEDRLERALTEAIPGTSANYEHTAWDRWDVRAPTTNYASLGRPFDTQYGATILQIWNYKAIYWESGSADNNCLNPDDAYLLRLWLTTSEYGAARGLYLAGDGIVTSAYQNPYEPLPRQLLEEQAGVSLRCPSFRNALCPSGAPADPAICVTLDRTAGSRTAGKDRAVIHQGQGNGCPDYRKFDVVSVNATGSQSTPVGDERYEGSVKAAAYSSVSNLYLDLGSPPGAVSFRYRTVTDGISVLHRRDPGACDLEVSGAPTAMVERLAEVYNWLVLVDSSLVGIGDDPASPPTRLLPVVPNPVRAGSPARFHFTLAHDGPARIVVYDMAGRRVREVFAGPARQGDNETVWDLEDDRGQPVATGVYVYRLEAAGAEATRKIVIAPGH